jgi:hypothetical protein
MVAPDVGLSEEVAHMYFRQLLAGIVCRDLRTSLLQTLNNLLGVYSW